MASPETSSRKDTSPSSIAETESRSRRRRHGYRGYPNNPKSGEVHWGSGFAGIGSMKGPVGSSGILTERTRNDAARKRKDRDENEDTLDQ
jgi:hypothetical protein